MADVNKGLLPASLFEGTRRPPDHLFVETFFGVDEAVPDYPDRTMYCVCSLYADGTIVIESISEEQPK